MAARARGCKRRCRLPPRPNQSRLLALLNRQLERLTLLDVLLVAALTALPGWALVKTWRTARVEREAWVYQANRLVGVYRLDVDQTVVIGDQTRPHMKIQVRNGAIRVAESDCPKGVCRHAGWVRTPGRSIICVPNRVLVEVKGKTRDYDAESY